MGSDVEDGGEGGWEVHMGNLMAPKLIHVDRDYEYCVVHRRLSTAR